VRLLCATKTLASKATTAGLGTGFHIAVSRVGFGHFFLSGITITLQCILLIIRVAVYVYTVHAAYIMYTVFLRIVYKSNIRVSMLCSV
jgi:hypothetical protein